MDHTHSFREIINENSSGTMFTGYYKFRVRKEKKCGTIEVCKIIGRTSNRSKIMLSRKLNDDLNVTDEINLNLTVQYFRGFGFIRKT